MKPFWGHVAHLDSGYVFKKGEKPNRALLVARHTEKSLAQIPPDFNWRYHRGRRGEALGVGSLVIVSWYLTEEAAWDSVKNPNTMSYRCQGIGMKLEVLTHIDIEENCFPKVPKEGA